MKTEMKKRYKTLYLKKIGSSQRLSENFGKTPKRRLGESEGE